MAAVLRIGVDSFHEQYVRRVGIRHSLREFPDGDCVLFDNDTRTCRVYHARPRQCRTWPFWASNLRTPQTWNETCRCCPGANHGPLVPLEEVRARLELLRV